MNRILPQDLLKYQFPSNIKAAPHGHRAAFVLTSSDEADNCYHNDLYLLEQEAIKRLGPVNRKGEYFWEDDTHIIFPVPPVKESRQQVSTTYYRLNISDCSTEKAFELPLKAGELHPAGRETYYFTAVIDCSHPDEYSMSEDDREKLIRERTENADYHIIENNVYYANGNGFIENTVSALFSYSAANGAVRRITAPDISVQAAAIVSGKLIFSAGRRKKLSSRFGALYCYDFLTESLTVLYDKEDFIISDIFDFNGQLLLLATDCAAYGLKQNPAFYLLKNGEMCIFCDPDLAYGSTIASDCRYVSGNKGQMFEKSLYFIATEENRASLMKLTPEGNVLPVSSAEGSVDCFTVTTDGTFLCTGLFENRPAEVYQIGNDGHITRLSDFNGEAIRGKYIASPEMITIKSEEQRIDGWILKPINYDRIKTYPGILHIHGGPKTAFGAAFFHEMQFWASLGYFVFYCNPMGSDGRGNDFMDIRGKYGTVEYQNIMDFTDAVLAKYPEIDRNRIAVTGGSYGGFMTNWIIGHTNRFACAVSQRSISDWISFYGTSDIGTYFAADQQAADFFDTPEKLWDKSPLKYAANITTPTLFIHSDEDYRCPIGQAQQLFTALSAKGVDAKLVWFKGENHELSRSGKPKHRIKRLTEIADWIEKYTK